MSLILILHVIIIKVILILCRWSVGNNDPIGNFDVFKGVKGYEWDKMVFKGSKNCQNGDGENIEIIPSDSLTGFHG